MANVFTEHTLFVRVMMKIRLQFRAHAD